MEPPGPVQIRVKLLVVDSAPLDEFPFRAFEPVQSPDAVQAVALVVLHLRLDIPPTVTLVVDAESETVGAGGGTVIVTVA